MRGTGSLAIWFWLMGTAVLMVACGKQPPPPGEIVARVGDQFLTRKMVESQIPASLNEEEKKILARELVEYWVAEMTLAQAARQAGFEISQQHRWQLDLLKAGWLSQQLVAARISPNQPVSEAEIQQFYQDHQDEFRRQQEEVHLVHLFVEKVDPTLRREIRSAKSLLEVIQKNYLDRKITPILEPNGDLGYVAVNSLRKEFQRAIARTSPGKIYGPIKTSDGYHFLQVLDKQPAGSVKELFLVREEIVRRIQRIKFEQQRKLLLEQARQNVRVETFYQNLD